MRKRRRRLWLAFDRALAKSLTRQVAILGVVLLVALLLSYVLLLCAGDGLDEFCKEKEVSFWVMPFYLLVDANALNTLYIGGRVYGWMLMASTVVFLLGMFIFNGMIISVMTNAIDHRARSHDEGLIHYLTSGHYVVMGYDDMAPSVIAHIFRHDPSAYVLMLTSVSATTIRERLRKSAVAPYEKQIIINYGHRTSSDDYDAIRLDQAEELYIVGNRQLPAHDAANVECVNSVCAWLTERRSQGSASSGPRRITCVFEDPATYAAFQTTEIFGKVSRLGIKFLPYNFYAGWARQVFVDRSYHDKSSPTLLHAYPSIYGDGIGPADERRVHIVFVGITHLSTTFAIEAAHVLHFPNGRQTLITFIDQNADREQNLFRTRIRHFFDVQDYGPEGIADVRIEFLQGDIFSASVQQQLRRWATDPCRLLSVFLTMADQRLNFAIGMNMPDEVYDARVPIFIRQDRSDCFVNNLRQANADKSLPYSQVLPDGRLVTVDRPGRYAHIYPLGMNDVAFRVDYTLMRRARLINYLYSTADYADTWRFKTPEELDALGADAIRDQAEEAWSQLSVADKWSNLYCACNIPSRLASLRAMRHLDAADTSHDLDPLTAEETAVLARSEHNRWCMEKLLMGFRPPTAAEDKYLHPDHAKQLARNKKLFIHHDLRPYDELDIVSRLDEEIVNHIPWIVRTAG